MDRFDWQAFSLFMHPARYGLVDKTNYNEIMFLFTLPLQRFKQISNIVYNFRAFGSPGPGSKKTPVDQSGLSATFQISPAYWAMVRSEENLPDLAILIKHIRANFMGSCQASQTRS